MFLWSLCTDCCAAVQSTYSHWHLVLCFVRILTHFVSLYKVFFLFINLQCVYCMRCIESAIAIYGQVLVKVPTISIDKTDGCMVYLSKDSLTTQLVTAKSSEMNILVPDETGEFVSFAVLVLCLIRCVNRTRNNWIYIAICGAWGALGRHLVRCCNNLLL